MTPQRQKAEELIYSVLDKADRTHTNSEYYRQIFDRMSDEEFVKFFRRRLPLRFHQEVFKVEPQMSDIIEAFKILKKPLFERVKLPYVYINSKGEPVESQEALVIVIHIKRMKQMITKKNKNALNNEHRDMKTGLLTSDDKGGKETDREFEVLAILGLDYTMDELARPKADALAAKAEMTNAILSKGYVSDSDITVTKNDSLAKNLINAYLIGAHIHSNLIDTDYMTPLTAKNKKKKVEHID